MRAERNPRSPRIQSDERRAGWLGDVFQVLLIIRFEPEPGMAKAIKLHSWVMARFVHCNFAQIVT